MEKYYEKIDAENLSLYLKTLRGLYAGGIPGLAAECLLDQNALNYVAGEPCLKFCALIKDDIEPDLFKAFEDECVESYKTGFWNAVKTVEQFLELYKRYEKAA